MGALKRTKPRFGRCGGKTITGNGRCNDVKTLLGQQWYDVDKVEGRGRPSVEQEQGDAWGAVRCRLVQIMECFVVVNGTLGVGHAGGELWNAVQTGLHGKEIKQRGCDVLLHALEVLVGGAIGPIVVGGFGKGDGVAPPCMLQALFEIVEGGGVDVDLERCDGGNHSKPEQMSKFGNFGQRGVFVSRVLK